MNIQASSKTLRDWFKAQVETPKALQTEHDNMPFTRPDNAVYCRFTIKPADTSQRSIGTPGSNRYRVPGTWTAMLFGPLEKGTKSLHELADYICGKCITNPPGGGVTCLAPSVFQVGRAGKYWQVNASGEWFADKLT